MYEPVIKQLMQKIEKMENHLDYSSDRIDLVWLGIGLVALQLLVLAIDHYLSK